MSLCSVVTITTAVNTAAVVTVEMKRSCVPLQPLTALTASVSVSLILSVSLHSLPVPVHASALRVVDGGGRCEELHPSGEGGNMSER